MKKLLMAMALGAALVAAVLVEGYTTEKITCSEFDMNPVAAERMTASWKVDGTRYENFTDLGDYVVLLRDYDKSYDLEEALKKANESTDIYVKNAGCTGSAKLNRDGEVLMAHNMDLDITQSPAYLCTTSYGKYRTFGVNYIGDDPQSYAEIKRAGRINDDFLQAIPLFATDVMNEKGLYICDNMRVAKWRAGDEQPIRDAGNCWMTSLASGVNCRRKTMKMSFWEKMGEREITFSW